MTINQISTRTFLPAVPRARNRKIVPHFIEISKLGFISSCTDFTRAVNIDAMSAALKHNIVKSAVKSSFDIYCKRKYADPIAA